MQIWSANPAFCHVYWRFRSNERTQYSHPTNMHNIYHDFSLNQCLPFFCFVILPKFMFSCRRKYRLITMRAIGFSFLNWTQTPKSFKHMEFLPQEKYVCWISRSIEFMNVSYFPYWPNPLEQINKHHAVWMNEPKWFVLPILFVCMCSFCTNTQSRYTKLVQKK